MPIPATPDLLKTVIGGDVLPIVDDVGADSGALSYAKGWPPLTAMPLEAGGIAPRREYFNAVNALVSQHLYFLQSGGVYPWRDDLNYLKGWHILVDGEQYTALLPSGPDVLAEVGVVGPKPPVDNPEYWKAAEVTVEAATEMVAGIVELATGAEVQTGTDTTRAITPAGLAARTATDTRTGLIELATTAEAAAGTDTTRAVTPAGLAAYSPPKLSTAQGSAPSYSLRAWANITGVTTTAIKASGNVSSVVDNGTGDTTINFATAMPDGLYAILGAAQSPDTSGDKILSQVSTSANTATSCRVLTRSYAAIVDCPQFYIGIVR